MSDSQKKTRDSPAGTVALVTQAAGAWPGRPRTPRLSTGSHDNSTCCSPQDFKGSPETGSEEHREGGEGDTVDTGAVGQEAGVLAKGCLETLQSGVTG